MIQKAETIQISKLENRIIVLNVVGTTPIIHNRMTEKVQHELCLPRGKKTASEKQSTAKHNPMAEFEASPYRFVNDEAPTYLAVKATAFKGAMRTAALDLPGAKKSQVGRLICVQSELIPVYGLPEIFMSVVRSADMNRTPDIRTRAIMPKWAAQLYISFVIPNLNQTDVVNLLAAAGLTAGIGDWRPEKGSGSYGQFRIANDDDPELLELISNGGRAVQLAAMEKPAAYDLETEEMLEWYEAEAKTRGFKK
jgi:hypothetical protein